MKKVKHKRPRRTPVWMLPSTKLKFNLAHASKEAELGIALTKDAALSLILSDIAVLKPNS